MDLSPELLERLEKLHDKFKSMGQDMPAYLDGLLYADYLTYWDYIHLDTLLSLQSPKTPIPDEEIFIIYHQITELYFKLVLNAIRQLSDSAPDLNLMKRQLKRVIDYFNNLVSSFSIMVEGMDRQEFLKFRMSLLPASGFQSAQYRMIEIVSTDIQNLVHYTKREETKDADIESCYSFLYWKRGATELATGKKTLTLRQFEKKYSTEFIQLALDYKSKNLYQVYKKLSPEEQQDPELLDLLKQHDLNANVRWPLAHYRSAVRYLDKKPEMIAATGGTNWQKYLPPKYQRVIFYPEIWSDEELDNWGTSLNF